MTWIIETGSSLDGNVPHVRTVVSTRAEAEAAAAAFLATAPFDAGDFIEIVDPDAKATLAFLEWDGSDWFMEIYPP